jgi:hypothetical protein
MDFHNRSLPLRPAHTCSGDCVFSSISTISERKAGICFFSGSHPLSPSRIRSTYLGLLAEGDPDILL